MSAGFFANFSRFCWMYSFKAPVTTIFIFISIFVLTSPVHAEQCWQTNGCDKNIGWFRINKYQPDFGRDYDTASQVLFGSKKLPLVNAVVTIRRVAYLRDIDWSNPQEGVACHDKRLERNETIPDCPMGMDYMAPGTVVRILGYKKGVHLFALVQIVSYPPRPYEAARKINYDNEQVI
jgi:hypothetical protein